MIEVKQEIGYVTIPTHEYCALLEYKVRVSILLSNLPNNDDLYRVSEIAKMLGLPYETKETK